MKLGKAFTDSISQEKQRHLRDSREGVESWWLGMGRLLMFISVFCVAFFILLWRLFSLTIVNGHHFRLLADSNRTKELVRHAPRGLLLDRTGKPLVANIPYYRLLKPCIENQTDCVTPISREEGDAIAKIGLPAGTFLEVAYRRQYLYPTMASHVIGYTGELTQQELKDSYYALREYRSGDRIGRIGAEAVYEDDLRGRDGKELVEVNAQGKVVRTLGRDPEIPGENITLSIDELLQQAVMDAFPKGEKGAVIVSKPDTGEILAMYSSPTFDDNAFSLGLDQQEYNTFLTNPDRPLFDRAIGGTYPPGSTFKIVIALGTLEEGVLTRETMIDDVGVLNIGSFSFPNWYYSQYGKVEGLINIVTAIKRSNDIFFYKAGELLGITRLAAWARKVGIGKPLGIELGGEASGLMPDPAWKKAQFNTPADAAAHNDEWYLGDTYHVSIGQGYLLVTPLQVNAWTNIVATGGELCKPTIRKVGNNNQPSCKNLGIKKDTINLIAQGMQEACESGGTAWPLFDFGIRKDASNSATASSSATLVKVPVGCKTGTAEFGDPQNKTHAWLTAYAPLPAEVLPAQAGSAKAGLPAGPNVITGNPEISVTVLVEGAGEGSSVAAPVVKKILEAWFSR
jgi:penicillin-binding protein 2